jgi:hypothetical protein
LRLTEFDVSVTPVTMRQSFNVGANGSYLYFPAVTKDGQGDVFFPYSRSDASSFVSLQATDQLAGAPVNTISGTTVIINGQQTYNGTTHRWGDYSSAGPDPAQTGTRVWLGGEYAATGSSGNWGTAVGRVSP